MRELTIDDTILRAVGLGGIETCIGVPQWKLCFDIGRCPHEAIRWGRVLFTHSHVDHMGGVVQHCSQRDMIGMSPPEYAVPEELCEAFEDMMAAWRRLARSALPYTLRPVNPGDRFSVGRGRSVEVFRAIHRIPTVGYALVDERKKLKPELVGLPADVIRSRRLAGEDVVDRFDSVEMAFCGDTVFDVVEREELVRSARILILEVTFLGNEVSIDSARKRGHVHLDEVVANAHLLQNDHVVLTHFSGRYEPHAIDAILDARLPPGLRARTRTLVDLSDA